MAYDSQQVELLRKSISEWNAWRETSSETVRLFEADLRHANLSGADLGRANLQDANLAHANLSGANLKGAYLSDINLRGANLANADLSGATLGGANLRDADLGKANLSKAYLPHTDLQRATLTEADLTGAVLFRAYMLGVNLDRANLSDANLDDTNLEMAHLWEAKLVGAKLRGARLTSANLSGANMRNADLTKASLYQTNLRGAALSGAMFHGARVGATIFADVELSEVKGLNSVQHLSPSTIGVDTIYKSGGNISEVFLRGVGVDEIFISYIGSLVGRGLEFYSCFISYSRADKAFARQLHDFLQERGIRCWLDEHELLPGDDIYAGVDRGIRMWDKVLLCCTKDSLKSWWVDNEIGKAFAKEQELMRECGEKKLALIPLNLDGSLFTWSDGKADEIRRRLAADFTGWESDMVKFQKAAERLVKALMTGNHGRARPPSPLL